MREILKSGFCEYGLEITDTQISQFEQFHALVEEKNKVMNLTAITGIEDTARLHFLDCAYMLSRVDFAGKTVIDVGTGAGFPGVPLIIACPEIKKMTLLDSLNKRIVFLQEVLDAMDIANAEAIHSRAEDATDYRENCDIAVSRAVARLSVLLELSLPFVKVGGHFIAMKGPRTAEELAETDRALLSLGGEIEEVVEYKIPETDVSHTLIIIKKVRETPDKFPRKFAMIKKAPL